MSNQDARFNRKIRELEALFSLYRRDEKDESIRKKTIVIFFVKRFFWLVLLFAAVLVALSVIWFTTTWAKVSMSEILFHLTTTMEGTGNAAMGEFFLKALIPAIAVSLVLFALYLLWEHFDHRIARNTLVFGSVFILIISVYRVSDWVGLPSYIMNLFARSDFISENYADPEEHTLVFPKEQDASNKDRNLIFLFLESMESTFATTDVGGGFNLKNQSTNEVESIIPNLTGYATAEVANIAGSYASQVNFHGEDFSSASGELNGALQVEGTGWTVGSIFAHTTGLPLWFPASLSVFGAQAHNHVGDDGYFYPEVIGLTDILAQEGYQQAFMCGSYASYGGRTAYFFDHGLTEADIYDYPFYCNNRDYLDEDGNVLVPYRYKDNVTKWWGFEDHKLFHFAKEYLKDYAAGDQSKPFNLMFLTVDTHFTDGWVDDVNEGVYEDIFGDQYANVYRSSDKQIADFVNWFLSGEELPKEVVDNTTLVLVGDHNTMDADFCENLPLNYHRKQYTCYFNHESIVSRNTSVKDPYYDSADQRVYSPFDAFPTVLATLGVKERLADGSLGEIEALGLGRNLFSGKKTLLEEFTYEYVENELLKTSPLMKELYYGSNYPEESSEESSAVQIKGKHRKPRR